MGTNTDIAASLYAATQSQTLKSLKQRKIQKVRVITRSAFQQVLEDLRKDGAQAGANENKRITRLLEEVSKLGQAKISLEHEKGLLEAERSRMKADLCDVAQAMGKQLGEKLPTDDVRGMVKELVRLRDEREKTRQAMDTLQKQAKSRIEEEVGRGKALRQEREDLVRNLECRSRETQEIEDETERLRGERDQILEERNAHRDHTDEMRAERDQYRHERDEYRDERDLMREQRDQYREERDLMREQRETMIETQAALEAHVASLRRHVEEVEGELDTVQQPAPEPEAPSSPSTPSNSQAQPTTPRRARGGRAPKNFGFGFGFGGKQGN